MTKEDTIILIGMGLLLLIGALNIDSLMVI